MNCRAQAPTRTHTSRLAWGLLLVAVLVPLVAPAVGDGERTRFAVIDASTRLVDEVYLLDARVDFAFSDEAIEALENGVPLTVELQIEVRQARAMLWDSTVASLAQRYRLDYRALSDQFQVTNLNTGELSRHARLHTALNELGRLRDFPMLDRRLLRVGERYSARLRAALDVESLPLPLRPVAYLSQQWNMNSDWHEWLLAP
jgi:hypothetical protein